MSITRGDALLPPSGSIENVCGFLHFLPYALPHYFIVEASCDDLFFNLFSLLTMILSYLVYMFPWHLI